MRFGHKRRHGGYLTPKPAPVEDQEPEEITPPVEPEQPEEPETPQDPVDPFAPDASGRIWDEERYQVDEHGLPRLSTLGNFILKPGQSHAE